MTRKPVPAPDPRPMPPRPATGGVWSFDPVAWAFVPEAAPVESPVEPAVQPDLKEG
jgi:hypothetical protein